MLTRNGQSEPVDLPIPSSEDLQRFYRRSLQGSSEQVSLAMSEIEQRIVDQKLVSGQRLIEADIAADLGIARGRVREALRILAGEGMIELVPNRGARVNTLDRAGLASMMEVLAGVLLTGIDIFGERHGIPAPPIAAALQAATDRITDAAARGNAAAMLVHQTEFHVLINHLSGNAYLNLVVSRMNLALYEKAAAAAMSGAFVRRAAQSFARASRLIQEGRTRAAKRHLHGNVHIFIRYLRGQTDILS